MLYFSISLILGGKSCGSNFITLLVLDVFALEFCREIGNSGLHPDSRDSGFSIRGVYIWVYGSLKIGCERGGNRFGL